MKHTTLECDVVGKSKHNGSIRTRLVPVMFDHDQEDGKSKVTPYFEMANLEICDHHFIEMTEKRRLIYAYGAMGHNDYSLFD